MQDMKKNLFDGSLKSMFSFFVTEEKLTEEDISELLRIIRDEPNREGGQSV